MEVNNVVLCGCGVCMGCLEDVARSYMWELCGILGVYRGILKLRIVDDSNDWAWFCRNEDGSYTIEIRRSVDGRFLRALIFHELVHILNSERLLLCIKYSAPGCMDCLLYTSPSPRDRG